MSGTSWLVLAIVPGVDRRPLQKLPVDESRLFKQLEIWREEAGRVGKVVQRIVVAFEAGRDGFWLARWLQARGVEVYVIHPASAISAALAGRAAVIALSIESKGFALMFDVPAAVIKCRR